MRYLLDTNVISDIAGCCAENAATFSRKFQSLPNSAFAISAVTDYELGVGLLLLVKSSKFSKEQKQRLIERTNDIRSSCEVLPVTVETVREATMIQQFCIEHGIPLSLPDALIAGHAVQHDMTLVSHDRRAFAQIPASLLKWEDWRED